MITIKDIAKIANVSPGTVDRVIHNRSGVSEKTKEKIQQILKEHKFKINTVARSLALRKKYTIAVLIPDFDEANLFWKSPFMGVSKAADEMLHLGMSIEVYKFNQLKGETFVTEYKKILETKPDAVIFSPYFIEETLKFTEKLDEINTPYIFINLDVDNLNNLCFIGQDAYQGGFTSAKLMHISTGGKTEYLISLIASKLYSNTLIENRIRGFKDYFLLKNIDANYTTFYLEDLDDEGVVSLKLNEILNENPEINGIWVPSSRISIISNSLPSNKLNNLSLIGFDTTIQNVECLKDDKVTFLISQKSFNQGYRAIKTMADYLIQNKNPSKKIYSPIEIITKENAEYSQQNKWEYKKENNY
ncbi:transcriptional regulator, LacI family [Lutibacter oricola]|uniref:Transcriptional regulator, LacI family n=1 Tax=Lutibacter oricola TaxID=762486 RepID=A0A1H3DZU6_9FLAO|nr:LacI family DNA-binding transcriptional regulator [Lutibacter oricola]SDX71992.1 transcriptional regulator, LacI family [Lutibacter oricola]